MALTVIGPTLQTPSKASAPLVQVRQHWSDQWQHVPDLEVVSMSARSAGDGLGECVLRRRFGPSVKYPFDAAFMARQTIDLSRYWVRVDLVGEFGLEFAWVGRISTETRTVHAAQGSPPQASGVQTWTAYEPVQLLRKIGVSESIWYDGENEKRIGWVPAMNRRDERNVLPGNRSDSTSGTTYVYGGSSLWSRFEYLDYILARFVDDSASGGPSWTLGGQADILDGMTDTVSFDGTETVEQIIRRLIPPTLGIDFTIRMRRESPSPGFEIFVYALSSGHQSFAGITLPSNPNTVVIPVDTFPDAVSVRIVETLDNQYDRINVIGRRIVVCCSLEGIPGVPSETDLVPLWTAALQAAYEAGTGTPADEEGQHDAARKQDRFRPVFQHFGAPDTWNHQNGATSPSVDESGELVAGQVGDYQNQVRRTLSWIPLLEGVDYSTDPPSDENPSGVTGELRPPAFYVLDEDEIVGFVPSDTVGIGVQAMPLQWGLALSASPNHLLGLNDFPDDPPAATETEPKYDHTLSSMTIAFETDQRLKMTFEQLSGTSAIAETINIFLDDAECWYLAPGTIVGVEEGRPDRFKRSGDGRVLRNDVDRLAFVMAGAIARYNRQRARAEIRVKGLWPWPFLMGSIVDVIHQAGQTTFIGGPITAIEWIPGGSDNPDPVTVIRTGFAR